MTRVDQRTWDAWESARLRRAQVARGEAPPGPVHAVLFAFRQWKAEAYSCCADAGRWRADCPVCGCVRSVAIAEFGDRGAVALWCQTGCSQDTIVEAVDAWRQSHRRDSEIAALQEHVVFLEAVIDRLCECIAAEVVA